MNNITYIGVTVYCVPTDNGKYEIDIEYMLDGREGTLVRYYNTLPMARRQAKTLGNEYHVPVSESYEE